MRRLLLLFGLLLGFTAPSAAQDAASVLLPRVNNLRAANGLPAYALHASLTAAANHQARWMAETGEISHTQADGSGPRTRALNAGFPSSWVSENIYRGASALTAWNWWLNSPVHYAGLVSPNYDKIGIGSASGARGNTYVLVFGNSTGRLLDASGQAGAGASSAAAAGSPAYVLGLDELGNIRHQIQPGQDLGTIALIYGYTWDDIAYMLEINGMSWEDIRLLQPGAVFLVPPKDGTYTPAPPTPARETATASATVSGAPASPSAPTPTATSSLQPTEPAMREIRIAAIATATQPPPGSREAGASGQVLVLGAAILVQLGILAAASLALVGRWR